MRDFAQLEGEIIQKYKQPQFNLQLFYAAQKAWDAVWRVIKHEGLTVHYNAGAHEIELWHCDTWLQMTEHYVTALQREITETEWEWGSEL